MNTVSSTLTHVRECTHGVRNIIQFANMNSFIHILLLYIEKTKTRFIFQDICEQTEVFVN